jgi:O-antigen ligase
MVLSNATAERRIIFSAALLMIAVFAANLVLHPQSVLLVLLGTGVLAFVVQCTGSAVWAILLLTPVETFGPITFLMTKSVKLALAMVVACVLHWRSSNDSRFSSDPYRWPLLLIAVSGFFSTLLARSPWTSMTGLLSILVFVALYRSLRVSHVLVRQNERVLATVMWAGVFCSVLCMAQLVLGYDGILGSPEQRAMQAEGVMDTFWPGIERGSATLNGPSAAGAFCAIAVVIALTRALIQHSRLRYLIAGLLCVGGVLATFSRGALLGLLAGCCFASWTMGFLSRQRLCLIGGLAIVLVTVSFAVENVRNYLRLGSDLVSVSESRVDAWQATRTILASHPVFGIGFYEFREFAQGIEGVADTPLHPHNGLLKALVEEGPVGGIGYLLYVAVFMRTAFRAARQTADKYSRWVQGAIAGAGLSLFTQELFDANLTIGGSSIAILFAILLALQVSLLSQKQSGSETAFPAGGFALAT